MNGPVTGPLIGGFAAEYLGWRWTNWLVMILSGVGWIMISCIKETYAPSILKWRAAKLRKETGDDRWWCRYDQRLSRKSDSTILGPKTYHRIFSKGHQLI
jgi:MFS family permease